MFCLFTICPLVAKAENAVLEEEYLKGVYFVMTSKEGEVKNQQAIFRLNNKIAYCLEPAVAAKAGEYRVTEGLSGSYLSKEDRTKVEEFGYYGYDYPNHQTVEYYLATQELIWETVSNYQVKWMTSLNDSGTEINIENEKQEIVKLIEANKNTPSFHLDTIYLYEGEQLRIYDSNKILNTFSLNNPDFTIEDNYLISTNLVKNTKLKGTKTSYDKEVTLLYRQENSQKMASLRLSDPVNFETEIVIEGTSLKIHKTGEVWNGIWNSGEWKNQNGVEFELYAEENIEGHFGNILYKKGEMIETIITKNGYATTKKLPNGKYKLVETKTKEGYTISEPILFEIDNTVETEPILEIQNLLSTGTVEIKKTSPNGQPLSGVIYGLYSKSGKKLDEQITDEFGRITWQRLPIGEYQIRELKTQSGFVLDTTKERILVTEGKTTTLDKINVPLLPNTSGKTNKNWSIYPAVLILLVMKKRCL